MNRLSLKKITLACLLLLPVCVEAQINAQSDWVEFIPPQVTHIQEIHRSGEIPLADSRHIGRMKTKDFNHTILSELRKQLSDELVSDSMTLSSLQLVGFGAPIGNWQRNETRAAARSVDLKAYLMDSEMGSGTLNVSWVTEDWDSLATLIADSRLVFRHAASDIINNVGVVNGRENELRMLGGGSFYKHMQRDLCPQLCRVKWSAVLKRTVTETSSGIMVLNDGHNLTLSDFYNLACRFEAGSPDFCKVIELCERYYPDNDVARLNAAAAALVKGDLHRAGQLLKPYEADPRAYNNLAVFYKLKGYRDQAKVYLHLASAYGSKAARKMLER